MEQGLRILGNILWHIPFCGFLSALAAFVLGALLTLTVVAAPIGLGLLQYARFLLLPFSWCMISRDELEGGQNPVWRAYSFFIMLLYLPFGLLIMLCAVAQAVALAVTIVGIPTALVVAKSLGTLLNPVGKVSVHADTAAALRRKRAEYEAGRFGPSADSRDTLIT